MRFLPWLALIGSMGCGPSEPAGSACPGADLQRDEANCGSCGTSCGPLEACNAGVCTTSCSPGAVDDCYSGPAGTEGVGPCHGAQRTCAANGTWGYCAGEVTPVAELCGNGLDENCSGEADEDVDVDNDGFSTCDGDCCDNTGGCTNPVLVNPGAFEAAGNNLDDDCDGAIDNATAPCDTPLASDASDPLDYARAIDLCQTATEQDRRWGVISAKLSLANGGGVPAAGSRSIRTQFGANVTPRAGGAFALFSTGYAADTGDSNPSFASFDGSDGWGGSYMVTQSAYPPDFAAHYGGNLPNAPGCPAPTGVAFNPVMLTLRIRVPTNAKAFSLSSNLFTSEYPEYVCSPFNDFFAVLLDSTWSGAPANPVDKNLAVYTSPSSQTYPMGVNLAFGNTGLFKQCINGTTGCRPADGAISGYTNSCVGTSDLVGTGFDLPRPPELNWPTSGYAFCAEGAVVGGATGWLELAGNVVGGEVITLRIAIWDTSDELLDSLVVLDNFQWLIDVSDPGIIVD